MRESIQRFGIVTGFGILGCLLLLNAVFTRRQVQVQTRSAYALAHSQQVLYQIEQTESLLTDAETGQRGFLYTGDPKYLAPYRAATAQIDGRIDSLASLLAGDPSQQQNIAQLRALSREKLGELARTIALYQAGQSAQARALVVSDRGLQAMDSIRALLASMRAQATRLNGARSAAYAHAVQVTLVSIDLATGVALAGIAILAFVILRERRLRERHALELHAREAWFRVTLTSIGDAVIATDASGNVTFLNPVAEALTGNAMASSVGKSINEVFPIINEVSRKPVDNPVKKVMELGKIVGLANHTALVRSDGTEVAIEDSAAPIRNDLNELVGVVLVFRDVTADRKAEEVLRRAEKLSAAARLSATVAHEINNPLAAVVNLLYIVRTLPETSPEISQYLVQAEQELDRVSHIVRQTLAFYRESKAPEEVDVALLVESVLRLYSNKIAVKKITVQRSFDGGGPIQAFAGELRQAVSNLVANAIDAVAEHGTISISARRVGHDGKEMVEIVVADDGAGIEAHHAERLFEPFFTTKKNVGTGLGLWAAKSIVERHGGQIALSSHTAPMGARGAAFTIRLPRELHVPPAEVSQ